MRDVPLACSHESEETGYLVSLLTKELHLDTAAMKLLRGILLYWKYDWLSMDEYNATMAKKLLCQQTPLRVDS